MKKQIFFFGILALLSLQAFAQKNNATNDILLKDTISSDYTELVLKTLPPTITLSFAFDNYRRYTINFTGGPISFDQFSYQPPEKLYRQEGAQHVQPKESDFDGSKLLLSFAGGKLTGIGSRTLETPVSVPVNETGFIVFFTKAEK